jgi:nicotinate-nucleotide adenylyltransferase
VRARRVGVFGGTFDPPHMGHLAAAEDAAAALDLNKVLFVPNRIPPHKSETAVTDPADRAKMASLAIAGNPRFELSLLELEREGLSYTLDTMRELRRRYGDETGLVFLTGCDTLGNLHTWHEPETLLREFEVVVLERPTGVVTDWESIEKNLPRIRQRVKVLEIPLLEISSADLRRRIREGRPIRYYVPGAVRHYIEERGLYRPDPTGRH